MAVCGTYYVQAHTLPAAVVWRRRSTDSYYRRPRRQQPADLETDRRANKRTLAVRLGRRGTQLEYVLLLLIAYLTPLWLWLGEGDSPWVLLPWLSLPLTMPLLRSVFTTQGKPLNATLAGTARLSLLFSILLAVGLLIAAL
ncbi:MAG: hypothetical protein R3E79_34465 [Caldilineaceae bacterium]